MASTSIRAPMRSFRPLSRRLRVFDGPCQRNLSGLTSAQHALQSVPRPIESCFSTRSQTTKAPLIPSRPHPAHVTSRAFSNFGSLRSKAIINPRKDDDGNDMLVDITPRASNRLHAIAQKDSNPSLCLRVTVESGGCHGFQYLMSLTSLEEISKEEDTVFESEDGNGAKVVLDEPSLELLKGSNVDYTMELIGSQFKVTGIPGAKSSCGCGTSFDIQA